MEPSAPTDRGGGLGDSPLVRRPWSDPNNDGRITRRGRVRVDGVFPSSLWPQITDEGSALRGESQPAAFFTGGGRTLSPTVVRRDLAMSLNSGGGEGVGVHLPRQPTAFVATAGPLLSP